jgi:uncharacterized protein (TIGR00159 family)
MVLNILGFLHLTWVDILDIIVVALLIYVIFRWIRGTSAMNIFIAIIFLFLVRIIAVAMNMKMLSSLMGTVIDVGAIALVVIFQPEIRQFLNRLGRSASLKGTGLRFLDRLFGRDASRLDSDALTETLEACRTMSEEKTGALLVLPRKDDLERIIQTGDRIDARISRRLILNIFFKNSPLHDGAAVLSGNRMVAARCTLPITEKTDIPARYGMRHKAAIGLTEGSDAAVIVVSEQTGRISFAVEGRLQQVRDMDELRQLISGESASAEEKQADSVR